MPASDVLSAAAHQISNRSPDLKTCPEFETKVATALVLCAIIHVDGKIRECEKNRLLKLGARRFGIESEIVETFWKQNETRAFSDANIDQLAEYLKSNCSQRRLLALIRDLWDIATVDRELDPREETMIYQLADKTGISRRDVISLQAKVCQ